MELLTKSRLAVARSCRRKHRLMYLDGYRPVVEAETHRFGTLFHRGVEPWWRGQGEQRIRDAFGLVSSLPADPFDLARVRPLLAGYHLRWGAEPWEVLAVEQEFETDLVNPATGKKSTLWKLAGKLDAVVRHPATGKVYVVEHKTSSEDITPGSDYWRRLRMDAQVSVYYDGALSLGYPVAGVLYDVIGKPQLRPYQVNTKRAVAETPAEFEERVTAAIAENPAKYFQRGDVVRLEAELVDARADAWELAKELREAELAGRHPRNPDACDSKWGYLCPFFDVCTGAGSLEDASRFTRSTNVHPELAGGQPKEEAAA